MAVPLTTSGSGGPAPELMYFTGSTATTGIAFGSPLSAPAGYAALVVANDRGFDAVGPGEYIIDAVTFPKLAQALKVQPGQAPKKQADLSVYMFNIAGMEMPWRSQPVVTKNLEFGVTYCDLRGRCSLRVASPAGFYGSFKFGWARIVKGKKRDAKDRLTALSPGQQAAIFVGATINSAVKLSLESMQIPPDQLAVAGPNVAQNIGAGCAAALKAIGVECLGFELTGMPAAQRAPCAKCGSAAVPTGYGVYRRTISLLYIRFGHKREGNFCVPCAAQVSAAYNGTMLVCGWWGIIGIVLTPIYIAQNCYYFLRTAFGKKIAAGAPDLQQAPDGNVWPPAPMADWGQEVDESR